MLCVCDVVFHVSFLTKRATLSCVPFIFRIRIGMQGAARRGMHFDLRRIINKMLLSDSLSRQKQNRRTNIRTITLTLCMIHHHYIYSYITHVFSRTHKNGPCPLIRVVIAEPPPGCISNRGCNSATVCVCVCAQ